MEIDERTRDRVRRVVLERGPVTAAAVAEELAVTPAAVRRHLEALAGAGHVEARAPSSSGSRGRPARRYVLTAQGHAALASGYDDLATSALRHLEQLGGREAVTGFAAARLSELESRYRPVVEGAGADVRARVRALAGALSADGYAASTRPLAPTRFAGTQLCQGHCPVQHVAAEFPELCDAETAAFSRLLGVHVQRLATLAGGAHVCTTHVPELPPEHSAGPGWHGAPPHEPPHEPTPHEPLHQPLHEPLHQPLHDASTHMGRTRS